MAANKTPTQDAQAVEAALHKLESDYDIPVGNELHNLLSDMLTKYRDTLGIDPGYTAGGGSKAPAPQ